MGRLANTRFSQRERERQTDRQRELELELELDNFIFQGL